MRAYRDYSKLHRINMKNKRQDTITKLTFPLVKWLSNNFVDCLTSCLWYSVHGPCIFPIIILFRKLLLRDKVIFKSWILPRVNEKLKEWQWFFIDFNYPGKPFKKINWNKLLTGNKSIRATGDHYYFFSTIDYTKCTLLTTFSKLKITKVFNCPTSRFQFSIKKYSSNFHIITRTASCNSVTPSCYALPIVA